jgi:hypothetical protein
MKQCTCRLLLLALVVFTLGGCATDKVNWAARVGHLTLDQAILELGPPDKKAELTDGTVVADWLTRRGRSTYYSGVGGYYGGGAPYYYGAYAPAYLGTVSPNFFVRLTFGPDGELAAWKKYAQ